MAWSFSNSVGYRGYATITPESGTLVALLATGGNINLTQDPLTSQGVWGATPAAAAQVVAWTYNFLRLEGSISYDYTQNAYAALKSFAFSGRDKGATINMKPDGSNGYSGKGYCSGLTFSCSEGQIVTGDINFVGDAGGTNAITANGNPTTAAQTSQYNNVFGTGGNSGTSGPKGENAVVAYWATKVGNVTDAISWNCSYNSDIQLLKCCNGINKSVLNTTNDTVVGADYVLLGDMTGDGSYTIFTLKGDFTPYKYHGVKKDFDIQLGETTTKLIKIPYAIVSSGSTAVQTGASYITADFNFTAVGDGTNGPISLK